MSIYAKVIADSINKFGDRLTTVECRFHRFILPEVLTHRAFSRNVASNRAIPTAKLIEQVRNNPAIPLEFGKNQPGMQAGPELSCNDLEYAKINWGWAAEHAATRAQDLLEIGVHKQVVNRLLEPFLWTTAIISSTDSGWENFFDQRISPLAQPEIAALAMRIRNEIVHSEPLPYTSGQWHAPYIGMQDIYALELAVRPSLDQIKVSAARCARVSYLTHDGKRDIQKDLELYDKLVSADPPHWSPLEHVATPAEWSGGLCLGNFAGWHQLRHLPEYQ